MADGWVYKPNGCSHGWLMVDDVKNKSDNGEVEWVDDS